MKKALRITMVAVALLVITAAFARAERGYTFGVTVTMPLNMEDVMERGTIALSVESYEIIRNNVNIITNNYNTTNSSSYVSNRTETNTTNTTLNVSSTTINSTSINNYNNSINTHITQNHNSGIIIND